MRTARRCNAHNWIHDTSINYRWSEIGKYHGSCTTGVGWPFCKYLKDESFLLVLSNIININIIYYIFFPSKHSHTCIFTVLWKSHRSNQRNIFHGSYNLWWEKSKNVKKSCLNGLLYGFYMHLMIYICAHILLFSSILIISQVIKITFQTNFPVHTQWDWNLKFKTNFMEKKMKGFWILRCCISAFVLYL